MAEQLRVFVSSVMARGYLAAARERARRAIDSLPVMASWTFENQPAEAAAPLDVALREVTRCDVFVLLVANEHTAPVAAELDEAERANKPVLVFVEERAATDESPARRELLKRMGHHKYRVFRGLDELEQEVRKALLTELVTRYREPEPPIVEVEAVGGREPDENPGYPQAGITVHLTAYGPVSTEYRYSIHIRKSGWRFTYVPARSYEAESFNEGVAPSGRTVIHGIGFGAMGAYGVEYDTSYDVKVCVRHLTDDVCVEQLNVVTPQPPPFTPGPSRRFG